jgi:hypothetical protein
MKRLQKTKTMAQVFKRKSGPHKDKRIKSRTKQKQEWRKEQSV